MLSLGTDDGPHAELAEGLTSCKDLVPESSFVPATERIDVVPSLFIRERDFVWCDTHNLAILFMQLPLPMDQFAGQEAVDKRQSRSGPELGSRNFTGKGMKEEIVNVSRKWILGRCQLILWRFSQSYEGERANWKQDRLTAMSARSVRQIWSVKSLLTESTTVVSIAMISPNWSR